MAIVQDSYNISQDTELKISAGEYKRHGSVVRNNKGQIIEHLRPISKTELILRYAWDNREIIIKGCKVSLVIASAYMESKKKQETSVDVEFKEALKVYLCAIRGGALTRELIINVMGSLSELVMHPNFEKTTITLTFEELNSIFEYTKKIAEDNAIEFISLEKDTPLHYENPIIPLQYYLDTQKSILELVS